MEGLIAELQVAVAALSQEVISLRIRLDEKESPYYQYRPIMVDELQRKNIIQKWSKFNEG